MDRLDILFFVCGLALVGMVLWLAFFFGGSVPVEPLFHQVVVAARLSPTDHGEASKIHFVSEDAQVSWTPDIRDPETRALLTRLQPGVWYLLKCSGKPELVSGSWLYEASHLYQEDGVPVTFLFPWEEQAEEAKAQN